MKKELMSEGMMCQNCVKHVTHALKGIPGASHIQVSL
ncbi:heavy-metal-associated domain-containing protein [Butyricicoccus sp. AM05-1]|nr:heavy metal-associated domain-containing protein [Butyricicoccus sp. AM05-1]